MITDWTLPLAKYRLKTDDNPPQELIDWVMKEDGRCELKQKSQNDEILKNAMLAKTLEIKHEQEMRKLMVKHEQMMNSLKIKSEQKFDILLTFLKKEMKNCNVKSLKSRLKKKQLPSHGKKSLMINRLYDAILEDINNTIDIIDDVKCEWVGSPLKIEDGKEYHSSVIFNGYKYNLGDNVRVLNGNGDDWLARIENLYNADGGMWMSNSWFWPFSQIEPSLDDKKCLGYTPANNEVFHSSGAEFDATQLSLLNGPFILLGKEQQQNDIQENGDMLTVVCKFNFDIENNSFVKRKSNQMEDKKCEE